MAGYSTIVAPAGGAGVVVKRNCTLWELPSWICAGTVLSIAPEPTSETAMGFAVHPAVASSIGWKVWLGGASSGAGNVTTDDGGRTRRTLHNER